jgi:hypothetical protein
MALWKLDDSLCSTDGVQVAEGSWVGGLLGDGPGGPSHGRPVARFEVMSLDCRLRRVGFRFWVSFLLVS